MTHSNRIKDKNSLQVQTRKASTRITTLYWSSSNLSLFLSHTHASSLAK